MSPKGTLSGKIAIFSDEGGVFSPSSSSSSFARFFVGEGGRRSNVGAEERWCEFGRGNWGGVSSYSSSAGSRGVLELLDGAETIQEGTDGRSCYS
jgi:hypothetical protein